MKKFLYIFSLASVLLVSCSAPDPTPEEKAKNLMEQLTKNNLVKPDSYEFINMQFDSCFYGSQVSPEVFQFVIELGQLYNKYEEFKRLANSAESSLAIFAPSPYGYDSAFEKQQRKQYKEEFDKANRKKEDSKEKILQLYKKNAELLQAAAVGGGEFTGFYGVLQYRAETNGGYTRSGETLFFFDKDVTNFIAAYDGDELKDLSSLEDINYEFEAELTQLFSQE